MDSNQFDTLVKSLASAGTRRGLVRLVAALPLAGLLATLLPDETEAGGRRKRRKTRNKRQSGDDKENRTGKRKGKRKGKNRRTPASAPAGCTPTTCAAQGTTCGTIGDGCGGTLTCGCPPCQTCRGGECVADAAQESTCCNGAAGGQFCQSGACVAVPASGTFTQCRGACGYDGRPVQVCGATMQCPSCFDCPTISGCTNACLRDVVGPLDTGGYCVNVVGPVEAGACEACAATAQCCGGVACTELCEPGTCVTNCADKACGADDDCGGTCQTGTCPECQTCSGGTCINLTGSPCTFTGRFGNPATGQCVNGACLCKPTGGFCNCGDNSSISGCCSFFCDCGRGTCFSA